MNLSLVSALRLVRKDLVRLSDIHRQQCFTAIDPAGTAAGTDEETIAEAIETGTKKNEEEGGDERGLIYVRMQDTDTAGNAYEGWFTDVRRYPDTQSMPEGGALFRAGTTESAGIHMSQHTYAPLDRSPVTHDLLTALQNLGTDFTVTVKGAALKANPPFAYATAPKKKPVANIPVEPIELDVIEAHRYIQSDIRALSPQKKFQLLWGVSWKFAQGYTLENMEGPLALNSVCWDVDLGPHPEAIILTNGKPGSNDNRHGLVYLKVQTREAKKRVFEGWFYDKKLHPSTTTKLFWGCFLQEGTATPIGVSLENGKVKAAPRKGLADAEAIAAGFKKLGTVFTLA